VTGLLYPPIAGKLVPPTLHLRYASSSLDSSFAFCRSLTGCRKKGDLHQTRLGLARCAVPSSLTTDCSLESFELRRSCIPLQTVPPQVIFISCRCAFLCLRLPPPRRQHRPKREDAVPLPLIFTSSDARTHKEDFDTLFPSPMLSFLFHCLLLNILECRGFQVRSPTHPGLTFSCLCSYFYSRIYPA